MDVHIGRSLRAIRVAHGLPAREIAPQFGVTTEEGVRRVERLQHAPLEVQGRYVAAVGAALRARGRGQGSRIRD